VGITHVNGSPRIWCANTNYSNLGPLVIMRLNSESVLLIETIVFPCYSSLFRGLPTKSAIIGLKYELYGYFEHPVVLRNRN
jgi:hypothetical protein